MQPYRRFYGTTRIPGIPADTITEAAFPWQARHILVLARNNLYAMIVLNDDGQILALPDMERALTDIVNTARQADGVPVCILTAARRDDWARSREHLLSLSDTNRASLQTIEDSLFAVAMDSSVLNLPDEHASVSDSFTPESIDAQIRNISGVGRLGQNRWMDTSVTIVVEPNGRAGCMAEHSPCDASTSAIVMEYASVEPAPRPCEPLAENLPGTAKISTNTTPAFARIEFDVDNQIMTSIDAAFAQVRSICDESDVGELWFDDYGMDWIRRVAKQPPDAYIQQMLQLVMYKVTGEQTATYESASTRKFLHGRTDVIRSFSRESYEFLRAVRENQPPSDIYRKLSAATLAHTQLIRAASRGHGIDRHLAALRWVYNRHEDGPVTPNTVENTTGASAGQRDPFYAGADLLFNDPLFEESQTWRLSSSSMQASDRVAGGGFGSGYVNGMGIGYYPMSNRLKFGIESKHAAPRGRGELGDNPTRAIKRAIIDSLRYMRQVCEQGAPQDVEQARL
jgi:carnitine O-acetyltransferase